MLFHTTARLRLEDQVAVVTGGTRGIGEGIVRRFVEEGAKVVFSGRSHEKRERIIEIATATAAKIIDKRIKTIFQN